MTTQIYTNINETLLQDNQFNEGIQIIIKAFESQTNNLTSEINRLNEELNNKNLKINELEELCSSFIKKKDLYKNKISLLSKQNEELESKLNSLGKENNNLKQVKQSIISTIEANNNSSSKLNIEPSIKKNYSTLINRKNDCNKNIDIIKNLKQNNLIKRQNGILNLNNKNNKLNNTIDIIINKNYSNRNKKNLSTSNSFSNLSHNIFQIKKEIHNDFFIKCRNNMNKREYSDMIEIVHLFNSKQISKQDTYDNIMEILLKGNYKELANEFNKLFF